MPANRSIDNIRLGVFVTAGVLFLVLSLYLIGRNQSLFGPTFTISSSFTNINGLAKGNNVRFAGINVGTVKDIRITSDSAVLVVMVIDKKVRPHIHKNAVVSIGTDGLMGNKLVNINALPGPSPAVENGGFLISQNPVETDEMLRTLKSTNDNFSAISSNLKDVSNKLKGSNGLVSILSDTMLSSNLKSAAAHIQQAGANAEELTKSANEVVNRFKTGKGLAGAIFTDTLLRRNLEIAVGNIQSSTQKLSTAVAGINKATKDLETGKGPLGVLLSDSLSSVKLKQTIANLEQGTGRFNEDMEALKHNFLFRAYFRKQEKKAGK